MISGQTINWLPIHQLNGYEPMIGVQYPTAFQQKLGYKPVPNTRGYP
jgi:hypothetical protein